ncbi:MAG: hypothetical protein BYD32DRAFT_441994 [Podila humilis]|nr:MAG: hypothetical protein BYD32DRAFT_441994 [Podila humilis]
MLLKSGEHTSFDRAEGCPRLLALFRSVLWLLSCFLKVCHDSCEARSSAIGFCGSGMLTPFCSCSGVASWSLFSRAFLAAMAFSWSDASSRDESVVDVLDMMGSGELLWLSVWLMPSM